MKKETTLPSRSILTGEFDKYVYFDSFSIELQRKDVEAWELVAAFFQSAPEWVDWLLETRHKIVYYMGLKTGRENTLNLNPPFHPDQRFGLFRLYHISDVEAVLGEDDKHLDFRASLFLERNGDGQKLVISTLVNIKNNSGKIYFTIVKPFHRFIVPVLVRAMARKIDDRELPQHKTRAAEKS